MAHAYVHLQQSEGDLKFMAKYKPTHVSGNFEMLGFTIDGNTEVVFTKETVRKGKRVEYEHYLKFKNPDPAEYLHIRLSKKPDGDTVSGSMTRSNGQTERSFSRTHFCTAETKRGTIEVVFFKDEQRGVYNGKSKKLNHLGEPLKDDLEVFDAIKYLKLDATKV